MACSRVNFTFNITETEIFVSVCYYVLRCNDMWSGTNLLWFLTNLQPQSPNEWYISARLHGVFSHNGLHILGTAVRTSNLHFFFSESISSVSHVHLNLGITSHNSQAWQHTQIGWIMKKKRNLLADSCRIHREGPIEPTVLCQWTRPHSQGSRKASEHIGDSHTPCCRNNDLPTWQT
jgi:hypothetical protein